MTFAFRPIFYNERNTGVGPINGSITQPTDRSISQRFNMENIDDFRPCDKAAMNSGSR